MSGGWLWISVAGIRMIQSSICRAMLGFLAPWGSFIPFPFLSSSLLKSSHHCHLRIKIFATCELSYSPLESGKQWNSFIRREKEEKTADRKKQWRYPIQRHKTWWCRTKWDKRWKYTELQAGRCFEEGMLIQIKSYHNVDQENKSAELSLEFGAPVSKENVRWELIPYSEQLWNLGLTPPVIYCQTLNHQSQKAMISSSEEFYVFCGFPKYLKRKVFNWKCVCLVG